jgi:predicted RNase H-like nuclease
MPTIKEKTPFIYQSVSKLWKRIQQQLRALNPSNNSVAMSLRLVSFVFPLLALARVDSLGRITERKGHQQ